MTVWVVRGFPWLAEVPQRHAAIFLNTCVVVVPNQKFEEQINMNGNFGFVKGMVDEIAEGS
jgi:hypothetical protein